MPNLGIYCNSPGLSASLPDTNQISRSPVRVTKSSGFKGKCFKKRVFMLILTDFSKKFEIFDAFVRFYTILMVKKSRSCPKIDGLPDFEFFRLASLLRFHCSTAEA